jgi:hypothetical protein
MKLGIGIPLTTDREWTQFWNSFLIMQKPDYTFFRPQHRAPIDVVRNDLVAQALKADCTHLLLMDTDQVYHDQDMIFRMLEFDKPVLGTVVYRGYPPFDPLVFRFGEEGLVKVPDEEIFSGRLIEADAIGGGCILYKTEIFESIIPSPWFEDLSYLSVGSDKHGPGEDINICYKIRSAGAKIFVDTSILIHHLTLLAIDRGFYTLFKKLQQLKQKEAKGDE